MKPLVTWLDDFEIQGGRLWAYLFLAHATVACGWWWLMPGGFPLSHSRFWLNQVFPLIVVAVLLCGCYGLWAHRVRLVQSTIYAILGLWSGAVATAVVTFPVSVQRFGMPAGMVLALVWLAWLVRSPRGFSVRLAAIGFVPALVFGVTIPLLERAIDPSVAPRNEVIPTFAVHKGSQADNPQSKLPATIRPNPSIAMVQISMGPLFIDVSPLLTFESCSPDRCWTIFAPPAQSARPRRVLRREQHHEGCSTYHYDGDAEHQLQISANTERTTCEIESFSRLEKPIFSHLNVFAELSVSGHRRLSIAFSPCPDVHLDVEPSDYPVGRPARFAYLDAAHRFHVVESTSGEKGPFQGLASGPLHVDDVLQIMLYDEGRLVGTVSFDDWANQSSTELSPTAGWGVPQNAIEFRRNRDAPDSLVSIWLTLASTSIGRGWDSVGHSAGTYRNRVRIEARVP